MTEQPVYLSDPLNIHTEKGLKQKVQRERKKKKKNNSNTAKKKETEKKKNFFC